jgi:hypothetical protein
VRTASNAIGCGHCRNDMVSAKASIQIKTYHAVSYVDAMHRQSWHDVA